ARGGAAGGGQQQGGRRRGAGPPAARGVGGGGGRHPPYLAGRRFSRRPNPAGGQGGRGRWLMIRTQVSVKRAARRVGRVSEPRAVAFEFERVGVLRAGRLVLDQVTASIPAAGITVVSGPSGAGKTTLLRLCNRLEIPDAAPVSCRAQPLDELHPLALRRRVGMVFQRPPPFPGSVADNLAVAHPDAGTEELSPAMKRVALDLGLLGQEARTLSGGELQRMCLARTLVTQPETLLLDEPTTALDAQPKQVFENTARDLAGHGITIIWVTHDDAQAARVADRICQLRDGRWSGMPAAEVQPSTVRLAGSAWPRRCCWWWSRPGSPGGSTWACSARS